MKKRITTLFMLVILFARQLFLFIVLLTFVFHFENTFVVSTCGLYKFCLDGVIYAENSVILQQFSWGFLFSFRYFLLLYPIFNMYRLRFLIKDNLVFRILISYTCRYLQVFMDLEDICWSSQSPFWIITTCSNILLQSFLLSHFLFLLLFIWYPCDYLKFPIFRIILF